MWEKIRTEREGDGPTGRFVRGAPGRRFSSFNPSKKKEKKKRSRGKKRQGGFFHNKVAGGREIPVLSVGAHGPSWWSLSEGETRGFIKRGGQQRKQGEGKKTKKKLKVLKVTLRRAVRQNLE